MEKKRQIILVYSISVVLIVLSIFLNYFVVREKKEEIIAVNEKIKQFDTYFITLNSTNQYANLVLGEAKIFEEVCRDKRRRDLMWSDATKVKMNELRAAYFINHGNMDGIDLFLKGISYEETGGKIDQQIKESKSWNNLLSNKSQLEIDVLRYENASITCQILGIVLGQFATIMSFLFKNDRDN